MGKKPILPPNLIIFGLVYLLILGNLGCWSNTIETPDASIETPTPLALMVSPEPISPISPISPVPAQPEATTPLLPATPVSEIVSCPQPITYKVSLGSVQNGSCSNIVAPPIEGTCKACFKEASGQEVTTMICFDGAWSFTGSEQDLAFSLERYGHTLVTNEMTPNDIHLVGTFSDNDRSSFSGTATMTVNTPAFGDCQSPFTYTTELKGDIVR